MSGNSGVPCLLFLVANEVSNDTENPESLLDPPPVKGYALLPQAFKNNHPDVIDYFSRVRIQVISEDRNEPTLPMVVKNYRLMLCEAELHVRNSEAEDESLCSTFVRISKQASENISNFDEFGNFFNLADKVRFSGEIDGENVDFIKRLLDLGARIDYGRHKGGTMLHFAVKRGQELLVNFFFKSRSFGRAERTNMFEAQRDPRSPLNLAAKKGLTSIVKLFLDHRAVDYFEPFSWESRIRLDDWDQEKNLPPMTPLKIALDQQHLEVFNLLLEFTVEKTRRSINDAYTIPYFLREAVEAHLPNFVDLILTYNPSQRFEYNNITFHLALVHAKRTNIPEQVLCFEKLKSRGFKIVSDGVETSNLFLYGAIMKNWPDVVRILLEEGASVNPPCVRWSVNLPLQSLSYERRRAFNLVIAEAFTPIHLAAACANGEVIKVLIENGADINANLKCKSPLHYAFITDNVTAMRLLIAGGASFWYDEGFLSVVVDEDDVERMKLLFLSRSPLKDGEEALPSTLSLAAERHRPNAVSLLVSLGARLDEDFTMMCQRAVSSETHLQTLSTVMNHSFTSEDIIDAYKICCLQEAGPAQRRHFICAKCQTSLKDCMYQMCGHVIKRESANIRFPHRNVLPYFRPEDNIDEFRGLCQAEVGRMKTEVIGKWTFYDILTGNANQLAQYAKHKDVLKTYKTQDYKTKFPAYCTVLTCQLEKGAHRSYLINRGSQICSRLSKEFRVFPDIVKEKIMAYLSNYSLEVLIYEFDYSAKGADGV